MCVGYGKGRERDGLGVCRLCERNRGTECVCVSYVKIRERKRGTEWECVSVRYVKGRERRIEWVCLWEFCERKREG